MRESAPNSAIMFLGVDQDNGELLCQSFVPEVSQQSPDTFILGSYDPLRDVCVGTMCTTDVYLYRTCLSVVSCVTRFEG